MSMELKEGERYETRFYVAPAKNSEKDFIYELSEVPF